jgi:predicted nucleic acid-binding protein
MRSCGAFGIVISTTSAEPVLIIDSGGVSRLAERSTRALALIQSLRKDRLWPPVAPTVVLVESLQGQSGRDANTNRFLKTCVIETLVTEGTARRAAELRRRARRGSAVDAIVVALAEPGGTVLTGDRSDIEALATYAHRVTVQTV